MCKANAKDNNDMESQGEEQGEAESIIGANALRSGLLQASCHVVYFANKRQQRLVIIWFIMDLKHM